jgi:predicted transcriptional regulator
MNDEEFNSILRVLENPVRRKIIKRLSRSPSYSLQLSKDLGLGQPLVARHLAMMEKAGIVSSSMEQSRGGPDRRVYSLAKSISITLDTAPNLFIQRGFTFGTVTDRVLTNQANSLLADVSKISGNEEKAIASLSKVLEGVDERLDAIEGERAAFLYIRNLAMHAAASALKDIKEENRRAVIYSVLEKHTVDVEELSESLDLREAVVREALKKLEDLAGRR